MRVCVSHEAFYFCTYVIIVIMWALMGWLQENGKKIVTKSNKLLLLLKERESRTKGNRKPKSPWNGRQRFSKIKSKLVKIILAIYAPCTLIWFLAPLLMTFVLNPTGFLPLRMFTVYSTHTAYFKLCHISYI